MARDLTHYKKTDLREVWDRVQQIADGEKPGIISNALVKEDIEAVKEEAKAATEKAADAKFIGDPSIAGRELLLNTNWRDAEYCLRGRKFRRCMTLGTVARSAAGRLVVSITDQQYENV